MPQKNPEERRAYMRDWKAKNYVELAAKRKAYYAANKETILAKQRAAKAALPREVLLARRAAHYERHKQREVERYHQTRAWLPWLNSFRGSKQRANKHNVPFTLTKEWAETTWTGRCAVTGIEFVLSFKRSPYLFSPSLDRIDPKKGYTPENSRFVLHAVNALKGEGTDEDMLRIAEAIIKNKPSSL